MTIAITGTGLFAPPDVISNDELVASFNAWALEDNAKNAELIARGEKTPVPTSSADFIVEASGIRRRHVFDRANILDPKIMAPRIPERPNDAHSLQCEMSLAAAEGALAQAGIDRSSLDLVIVACSNMQRPYPAVAVEVQQALGARGFAFDMNVACSSATFGLSVARDMVAQGTARRALVVSPEICSAHLNFRDRDSHFIFGDACTAVVVQRLDEAKGDHVFEVLSTKLATKYSSAIRNNFGFLSKTAPEHADDIDKLFVQQGRKVFKEVSPMVAELIGSHLDESNVARSAVKRLWLHQANMTMNAWIAGKVLGREATPEEAPSELAEYANTSSCGSIIAFHSHNANLAKGDVGVMCSFGAGYSVGSVLLRKA